MKKYTVIQTYTAKDIYKNVEAESKEEAILKIGGLPVDEAVNEDTETEVKEENDQFTSPYGLHRGYIYHGCMPCLSPGPVSIALAFVWNNNVL